MRTPRFTLLAAGLIITACQNGDTGETPLQITAVLDTDLATIGDVFHLEVRVRGAGDRKVDFPDLVSGNPLVAVGNRKEVSGEAGEFGVDFELTFWDTGRFTLPPYAVNVMEPSSDSEEFAMTTDSLFVTISSLIDDQNAQLRDVKPPPPLPTYVPLREISSLGTIFILTGLLVWLWRKRVPYLPEIQESVHSYRSPYEFAVEKLAVLRNRSYRTEEAVRSFYEQLSQLVREFLETQYYVRSLEMTTEEIEKSALLFPLGESMIGSLIGFLKRADQVKFARVYPGEKECEEDLELMESFIEKARLDWIAGKTDGASQEAQ